MKEYTLTTYSQTRTSGLESWYTAIHDELQKTMRLDHVYHNRSGEDYGIEDAHKTLSLTRGDIISVFKNGNEMAELSFFPVSTYGRDSILSVSTLQLENNTDSIENQILHALDNDISRLFNQNVMEQRFKAKEEWVKDAERIHSLDDKLIGSNNGIR